MVGRNFQKLPTGAGQLLQVTFRKALDEHFLVFAYFLNFSLNLTLTFRNFSVTCKRKALQVHLPRFSNFRNFS